MELTGWYALVPLATLTLLTGLLLAVGTGWGLLQHYWVVIALVLTAVSWAVLLLHMPTVSAAADLALSMGDAEVVRLGGDVVHPGAGLVVLIVVTVLNVYKPRGRTRWGRAGSRPVVARSVPSSSPP